MGPRTKMEMSTRGLKTSGIISVHGSHILQDCSSLVLCKTYKNNGKTEKGLTISTRNGMKDQSS